MLWNRPAVSDKTSATRRERSRVIETKRRARRLTAAVLSLESRLLLSGEPLPLNTSTWTAIGPASIDTSALNGSAAQGYSGYPLASGRVTGIAADPTNPNVIFLSAAGGGVWKTTDGGLSWNPLTDNQPTLSMGAISVAPSNGNVIYAGTGEANGLSNQQSANVANSIFPGMGILVSQDGGATWTLENPGGVFTRTSISKIAVDPTNPAVAYAAVGQPAPGGLDQNTGIWKTTDFGQTWTNTTTSISTTQAFSDVVINPANPNNLFAAVGNPNGSAQNGVYVTTNGGATWALAGDFPLSTYNYLGFFPLPIGRISLAIGTPTGSTTPTIYASMYVSGATIMLESTNGGVNWTSTPTTPPQYLGFQGFYDNAVFANPTNPNILYAAGVITYQFGFGAPYGIDGVIETLDGGHTWIDLTNGLDGRTTHTDYHALTYDASGRLLVGSDGGIFRVNGTDPNGTTLWADLNSNLQITQFFGIGISPANPQIAFGTAQDNGTSKFAGNTTWNAVDVGDGGYVAVDPTNANVIYHNYEGSPEVVKSTNGGLNWVPASAGIDPNGTDASNFATPFIMDPSNPNRLLLGTDHVYETTNGALTWHVIGTPGSNGFNLPSGGVIDALATAPSSPQTIYVSAYDYTNNVPLLFVTNNDGGTWTQSTLPAGVQGHIMSITVDPSNAAHLYFTSNAFTGGRAFESGDGGTTFTDISGNLPSVPAWSIALDPTDPGRIFVGTASGLYFSTNDGASWATFRSGLPNAQVDSIQIDPVHQTLAVGTHGRGMFEILLNNYFAVNGFNNASTSAYANFSVSGVTVHDSAGGQPAGTDTAVIDWGDGSNPTLVAMIPSDQFGNYTLAPASHQFATPGVYTMTLTLTNSLDGVVNTKTAQVNVTEAQMTPLLGGFVHAVAGVSFTGKTTVFNYPGPNAPGGFFTAVINWGDGNTSAGTIVPDGNGTYEVDGTNVFAKPGGYQGYVTITDGSGQTILPQFNSLVTDAGVFPTPVSITNVVGQPFSGVVATFTSGNTLAIAADFTASIDWGDGNGTPDVTAGTVQADPNHAGVFDVLGTHTYQQTGSYTILVTINSNGGSTGTANSSASITDAAINATAIAFAPAVSVQFNGTVASFTSANPFATTADFTATINWGDGGGTPDITSASIQTDPNQAGGFIVVGSHTYGNFGTYPVTVLIDSIGGSTATANSTANVGDAPIIAFSQNQTVAQNQPFSGVVASFTDSNTNYGASNFTATVNWGDSTQSPATVTQNGASFLVNADHTYTAPGSFTFTVTITSAGGSQASPHATFTVLNSIMGFLDPTQNTGVAGLQNITRINTPRIYGRAAPNTVLRLFANPINAGSTQILLGTTTTDANGGWMIVSPALADGRYNLIASTYGSQNQLLQTQQIQPVPGGNPLIIATVGPTVAGVVFDVAHSQMDITYNQDAAMLWNPSLLNPAAYALNLPGVNLPVTSVQMAPTAPPNQETVIVSFNLGKRPNPASYVLTIAANSIIDAAGNTLQEHHFVTFPQTDNSPNPNYVAEFDVNGNAVTGPLVFIPTSSSLAAANWLRYVHPRTRVRPHR